MTDFIPTPDANPSIVVGRDSVYARLQQHILDPSQRRAIVYTGHTGIGKTTLLRHFSAVFDDPFLSIYTALSDEAFDTSHAILQHLIDAILRLLAHGNYSLSRLPDFDEASDMPLDDWFKDTFLPDVFSIIRPHRRIIWLVDDAQRLQVLGEDTLLYWHNILSAYNQFTIVMTLHTDYEAVLPKLEPLVSTVHAERLHRLSRDNSIDLIRYYATGANDEIVKAIFKATGGHPQFLNYYGTALRTYWSEYGDSEAFERAKVDAYQASRTDFRELWRKLTRDERLVLTAIASLIYDDPLHAVTPKQIEQWLVETDYLLDIVTINSALRGLDYRDIVKQQVGKNIELTMSLMQQWLLEQARLDNAVQEQRGQLPVRLVIIAVVIIVILIALVLWIPPLYVDNTPAIVTATLSS